jgi:hypothetical protein
MLRFAALAALAAASPVFAQPAGWRGGFAKVEITPQQPMWMSGYGGRTAPADGTETPLWAKAAVLSAGDRSLVVVSLDLVGIDRPTSQAVCKLITEEHKVPREAVVLACSHTHCGPVVGTNLRSMYFFDDEQAKRVDDYTAKLPGLILKAVDDAFAARGPVKLSQAVGTAGFAVNRRENKEADVPAIRARGEALKGPVDHEVPVLAAHAPDGKLKGVLFGYACHATVMGYQKWSGDYPGFAMAEFEAAHPGAVAVFFAGCGADQNPIPRRTVELAKGYGKQLATAVDGVLAKPMAEIAPEFAAVYREIDLPLHEIPSREAIVKDSMSDNKFVAGRAKMLLKKLDSGPLPPAYPYPVQTWRLGKDLVLVTLGGEVVVDFSLRLKKELGPGRTWVMGYANDVMAYIPSARVLKEGGYEGATAMIYYGLPSVWGPKVEELIVEEVHRQVKGLRK